MEKTFSYNEPEEHRKRELTMKGKFSRNRDLRMAVFGGIRSNFILPVSENVTVSGFKLI